MLVPGLALKGVKPFSSALAPGLAPEGVKAPKTARLSAPVATLLASVARPSVPVARLLASVARPSAPVARPSALVARLSVSVAELLAPLAILEGVEPPISTITTAPIVLLLALGLVLGPTGTRPLLEPKVPTVVPVKTARSWYVRLKSKSLHLLKKIARTATEKSSNLLEGSPP